MSAEKDLVHWLKDAYAMEQSVKGALESYSKDADHHPELRGRMQQHIEQSRRHAEMLEKCLERHGETTSMMKNAVGKMSGFMKGVSTGPSRDEIVKNLLASYAAENFEIACYRSLIAGAEAIGDSETARVCSEILRDEEEMADFIAQQIPAVTQQYLREQGGVVTGGVATGGVASGGAPGRAVGLGGTGAAGTMRDDDSIGGGAGY